VPTIKRIQTGFTLLEVILALVIVGLALGSVFGLLAGSKRLAFKAVDDIGQTLFLRSAINVAQVLEAPEYPEFPQQYKAMFSLQASEVLEKPAQQTRPTRLALEPYTWSNTQKGTTFNSLRWKKLETAQ
jgi:general secretion pathway protein I